MKKIVVFFMLFFCIIMFSSCSNNGEKSENADGISGLNSELIETPYVTLNLPDDYFNNVSYEVVCEKPYTLVFRAKKDSTELYSLVFNGTGEILVGTIEGEKSNTVIYLSIAELDSKNESYDEYLKYQSAFNYIINCLDKNDNFIANEIIEWEDNSTFDIKTSIVTMKYPNKWEKKVQIDVEKDKVKFSNNGTKLFDLMFTECDGILLGTYNKIPMYIVYYDVHTDEQKAMQMDVNVIIQNLMKDPKYVDGN